MYQYIVYDTCSHVFGYWYMNVRVHVLTVTLMQFNISFHTINDRPFFIHFFFSLFFYCIFISNRSVSNPTEVEFIVQLVMVILETGVRPRDVGIIAPYKNQKHLLGSSLARKYARFTHLTHTFSMAIFVSCFCLSMLSFKNMSDFLYDKLIHVHG